MSLRLLPYENALLCCLLCVFTNWFLLCVLNYKTRVSFYLFMKGLCSPRVLTPFNTLLIFVIYFYDLLLIYFTLLFVADYCLYYYLKFHTLFCFKGAAMLQNRLRKEKNFDFRG